MASHKERAYYPDYSIFSPAHLPSSTNSPHNQHCIRRRHYPSYLQRIQLELLCPCRTKGCLCYTLLNVDQPDQQFRKIMVKKKTPIKYQLPHIHTHIVNNIPTHRTQMSFSNSLEDEGHTPAPTFNRY